MKNLILQEYKEVILFLVMALNFFFIGCTEESALSDVDIDDPSIVRPIIFINKSITSSSITYTNVTWLFDKNNNSIELKSGEVKMNSINMNLKRGLNNEPYYIIEPFDILPFQLNHIYESAISLSDGKVYISRITTREKDLYQLNVPNEYSKNEDIRLSWADVVNDKELVLTMVLTGSDDSTNYTDVYEFNITNPAAGYYTVPKSYYLNRPEIKEARFTLETVITGEINKSFMNGSRISSTISITRTIKLK